MIGLAPAGAGPRAIGRAASPAHRHRERAGRAVVRRCPSSPRPCPPTHPAAPYGWMLRWRRVTEQPAGTARSGPSRPRRSTRSRRRRLTANTAAGQLVPDSDTFQRRPDRCRGAVHRGPTIVPQLSPGGAAMLIAGTTTKPSDPDIAIEVRSHLIVRIISTAVRHVKYDASHPIRFPRTNDSRRGSNVNVVSGPVIRHSQDIDHPQRVSSSAGSVSAPSVELPGRGSARHRRGSPVHNARGELECWNVTLTIDRRSTAKLRGLSSPRRVTTSPLEQTRRQVALQLAGSRDRASPAVSATPIHPEPAVAPSS